jgi:hypothetical protein
MEEIYLVPSFYAHALNGLLMLAGIAVMYIYRTEILQLDAFNLMVLILLFAIAVGIHGLSHLGLEQQYKFNPITKYVVKA